MSLPPPVVLVVLAGRLRSLVLALLADGSQVVGSELCGFGGSDLAQKIA